MRRFAQLFVQLDRTTSTLAKRDAMAAYLLDASAADAAWSVYILGGGKLKRTATSTEMRTALAEETGFAAWLIDDCYAQVGDLAETIALMLPDRDDADENAPLRDWMETHLPSLRALASPERVARLRQWWDHLAKDELFLVNKLLTGSLRVGVSQRLVIQAVAEAYALPADLVAHRLGGEWAPSVQGFEALTAPEGVDEDSERPYPFFLASPLERDVSELGEPGAWQAEWKWDGIRAQLIRGHGGCFLWSRGNELLEGRFPEIEQAAMALPDGCALDGEVMAWMADSATPLPFTALQKRINKRTPSARLVSEVPVRFVAYDLLKENGEDLRQQPLYQRRARLEVMLEGADATLGLSEILPATDWADLEAIRTESRARQTEGLMLKRLDAPYRVGRKRGDWWKWKIDPYTVDCVLLYAQPGHGRRSGLFTDYTFGAWDDGRLVPVAKAYSGLDEAEIATLDRWIRANTVERFGPVRSVTPTHVFELAFEAIQLSGRHKSGVALRFPRILRWRTDLSIDDAEHLTDLRQLATG
ncbi:MAG: DNA ligase B [Luteibacter sp.]|uniref:ATP-dependent DNA ligase n=1 Tax=Luteibacter sp. TaxID=1886636 RepID=UPI0013824C3A|nr:ATP-dependent DNA ligase [Luteibacter sp.]KAF1007242.1 MAG: DNA ligase B [Luteibacter sp.]